MGNRILKLMINNDNNRSLSGAPSRSPVWIRNRGACCCLLNKFTRTPYPDRKGEAARCASFGYFSCASRKVPRLPGRVPAKTVISIFSFFFLLFIISNIFANPHIIISEILKNPAGLESEAPGGRSHEFVELTNIGRSPFPLNSLIISDGTDMDSVISWQDAITAHSDCRYGDSLLMPGQSAVILDRDYVDMDNARFEIDAGTVLLTVTDADIGGGLAEDDGIILFRGTRQRMDTLIALASDSGESFDINNPEKITHSAKNVPEGYSVTPKTALFGPASYRQNPESLTVGHFENMKDGLLTEFRLARISGSDSTLQCSIACVCVDTSVSNADWNFRKAGNVLLTGDIDFSDNIWKTSVTLPLDSGSLEFIAGDTHWDVDISPIWIPAGAIRINEIHPRSDGTIPEWFEVINTASMDINLADWYYGTPEDSFVLSESDFILPARDYAVVTKDKNAFLQWHPYCNRVLQPGQWHTLYNYRDSIVLWDNNGIQQEAMYYDQNWFGNWVYESIERTSMSKAGTDSTAWVLADVPSPGQPNGSVSWRSVEEAGLEFGPVLFTPNGDGKDDSVCIRVTLPAAADMNISIYGFNGRKYFDFTNGLSHQITWDGRMDNGRPAPVGPYFIIAEICDPAGKRIIRKKGILWR